MDEDRPIRLLNPVRTKSSTKCDNYLDFYITASSLQLFLNDPEFKSLKFKPRNNGLSQRGRKKDSLSAECFARKLARAKAIYHPNVGTGSFLGEYEWGDITTPTTPSRDRHDLWRLDLRCKADFKLPPSRFELFIASDDLKKAWPQLHAACSAEQQADNMSIWPSEGSADGCIWFGLLVGTPSHPMPSVRGLDVDRDTDSVSGFSDMRKCFLGSNLR